MADSKQFCLDTCSYSDVRARLEDTRFILIHATDEPPCYLVKKIEELPTGLLLTLKQEYSRKTELWYFEQSTDGNVLQRRD